MRDCSADADKDRSDTGSDTEIESSISTDSRCDREQFINTVSQRVKSADCSLLTKTMIKRTDRNTSFKKVVLDRRRLTVPLLVCCSDDVILTSDTGTGMKDFHVVARGTSCKFGLGDDLLRCGLSWPDIDREGIYKEKIEELKSLLPECSDIVRQSV